MADDDARYAMGTSVTFGGYLGQMEQGEPDDDRSQGDVVAGYGGYIHHAPDHDPFGRSDIAEPGGSSMVPPAMIDEVEQQQPLSATTAVTATDAINWRIAGLIGAGGIGVGLLGIISPIIPLGAMILSGATVAIAQFKSHHS